MTDIQETVRKLEELLKVMREHSIAPSKEKIVEELEIVLDVLKDDTSSPADIDRGRTRAELLIGSRPV